MVIDDIAVLIITKCTERRVFNCITSIIDNISNDVLSHLKFYIEYTGDSSEDLLCLREFVSNLGLKNEVVSGQYNFAKNTNYLASLGTEPVILCINDDVVLKSDAITHCFNILMMDEKIGTVGIKLLFENNTIQHAGHLLLLRDKNFYMITHYLLHQPDRILNDFVSVGNTFAFCMFRRADFTQHNGLDEKYVKCFEDVQFNWQLLMDNKVNVTASSITAYHFESTTRKSNKQQLIDREDANRIVQFFNDNKDKILMNSDLLSRTIQTI